MFFGGTAAASFTVNSATQITAVDPAEGAGTVDITVTTAGGTSATSSADQFTYIAPPAIGSISPSDGSSNGHTGVVITGTNFTGASAVSFGGVAAVSFTVQSSTQIIAVAPAGTPATVNITVTGPAGVSSTSSSDQFTYESAPPGAQILLAGLSSGTGALTGTAGQSATVLAITYGDANAAFTATALVTGSSSSGSPGYVATPSAALPSGLNYAITTSAGPTYNLSITGTPSTTSTVVWDNYFTVTDSANDNPAIVYFEIFINPAVQWNTSTGPASTSTVTLPAAEVGTAYPNTVSSTISVTGGGTAATPVPEQFLQRFRGRQRQQLCLRDRCRRDEPADHGDLAEDRRPGRRHRVVRGHIHRSGVHRLHRDV